MEIRARCKVIIQCDPDIIISGNVLLFLPYDIEQTPYFFFPHWVCYRTCRAALLLEGISRHHKVVIGTLGSQSFLVIWEHRQQQLCHSQRACGYLCTAIELFEISCFPVQKGSHWASRWALVLAQSAQGPWLSITTGQHWSHFTCDQDIQHSFLRCSTVTLIPLMEVER